MHHFFQCHNFFFHQQTGIRSFKSAYTDSGSMSPVGSSKSIINKSIA